MNQREFYGLVAKQSGLSADQASELVRSCFDVVSRSLTDGEIVKLDGLGRFFTVKHQTGSDGIQGSREIILPYLEPEFEPDRHLEARVVKAYQTNPELFKVVNNDEEEEEEDGGEGEPNALPEDTSPKIGVEMPQPATQKPVDKPIGRASNIEFMDIASRKVDKEVLSLLPLNLAKQYRAVPIDLREGVLTVAMIDPEDFDALQEIRKVSGLTVKPVLSSLDDINTVLDQYTGLQAEVQEVISGADFDFSDKVLAEASQENVQNNISDESPTVKIVYSLLKRAVKEKASDIHIEPYERKVVVRFRQDGILQPRLDLPKAIQSAIVSRLKIMAKLKIDEQRLPQDGRFSLGIDHRIVDFRISTIPVVFGEKIVMRILDKESGILSLEDVGLQDRGLEVLKNNMLRSHGMILVTGPTGSGKTTSLYAVLGKLMNDSVNIITLEDPVEYQIESINQSQVHTEIGYGFASGLRAIVRQDPDIVMLGEIRDQETADMAIHAALTGHVVLSTLHTNDAAGAFPRLIDMHIEPFLMTSSIHTVIAQRLARKICPECKQELKLATVEKEEIKREIHKMPATVKAQLNKKAIKVYQGKGCDRCNGKGYKGRLGVFEVLNVSEEIRGLVLKRSSGDTITQQAIKEGMITMVQDGIVKALAGITTISEVWRVTRE